LSQSSTANIKRASRNHKECVALQGQRKTNIKALTKSYASLVEPFARRHNANFDDDREYRLAQRNLKKES